MNGDILFLTVEEILELHTIAVDRFGGQHGVRDLRLVESAAAQPAQSFGGQYLHTDIYEMAGALLLSLISNHAFIDGNIACWRFRVADLPAPQRLSHDMR